MRKISKELTYFVKRIVSILFFRQTMLSYNAYRLLKDSYLTKAKSDVMVKQMLSEIFDKAKKQSLFYKSYSSFSELPIVDKKIIAKQSTDFINRKSPFYNTFKFNTGGSTGEPFVFFVNRQIGYMDSYHQLFHHELMGYKSGDRIFAIDGVKIPDNLIRKNQHWILNDYRETPYGSYNYSGLALIPSTIEAILTDFEKKQPAILRGYPSAITEIAKYILKHNRKCNLNLKGIVLTAENIYPEQRILIKQAFSTVIYGQYGHSEKCIYAYTEADSEQYFCSPFYGYVEVLHVDKDKHVEKGEIGRVVVTSYYNDAMFFLRYDTGDLAEYGGVDKRGFVILNKILGRQQDFIYDKKKQRINITALIFGQHFKAFAHIQKWQIIQEEIGQIKILLIPSNQYTKADTTEIIEKITKIGFEVEITLVEQIALSPRGKYRLVDMRIKDLKQNG